MRRNPELFRQILMEIEASPPDKLIIEIEIPEEHPRTVNYHLKLLDDAGYLDILWNIDDHSREGVPVVASSAITNAGHDFLDSIRDDTIWRNTKEKLKTVGGSAALDTIKVVASSLTLSALGLS